ncbi:MAG: ABC transporter permease subunit [Eubacteriales bacterium]|nr:ABC transporter permease subunit [Eubacteriales bacterium]
MEKSQRKKESVGVRIRKELKRNGQLYVIIALPVLYLIVFQFAPLLGNVLAFKDYKIKLGIFGSPWAGLKYFKQFFSSPQFENLLSNTLLLSIGQLLLGFPLPIILALALNEAMSAKFKKVVQTVTFAPYFISTVVLVSLIMQLLDPHMGLLTKVLAKFGIEGNLLGMPSAFRPIYILSGIWQTTGYSAIIYIAALSSIDPNLYEAAAVDGATRFQRILHVNIPGILPTIVVMLILESGKIMNIGFEKVYLLQNDMNLVNSEIISTYVYKIGLVKAQYSFSTAVGLFNSAVNAILVIFVNWVAKKFGEGGLW